MRQGGRDRRQTDVYGCGRASVFPGEPGSEFLDSEHGVFSDSEELPFGPCNPTLSSSFPHRDPSEEFSELSGEDLSIFESPNPSHERSKLSLTCLDFERVE